MTHLEPRTESSRRSGADPASTAMALDRIVLDRTPRRGKRANNRSGASGRISSSEGHDRPRPSSAIASQCSPPSCECRTLPPRVAKASPARVGWNKTMLTVSAGSPGALSHERQPSVERNKPPAVAARAAGTPDAGKSKARPYHTVDAIGWPQVLQVSPESALANAPDGPETDTMLFPDRVMELTPPVTPETASHPPPLALRKRPCPVPARRTFCGRA